MCEVGGVKREIFPPVRAITERFVSTETAPAQVDGRGFLGDGPVGVLNDHPSGNLIGTILRWCDDYALIAHVWLVSVQR